MTLAARLEPRFRQMLAEARGVLDTAEPLYDAATISTRGNKRVEPIPAVFVTDEGALEVLGFSGHAEVASCGRVLEELDRAAGSVAAYEARAMDIAARLLVPVTITRASMLEELAEVWPWTRTPALIDNIRVLSVAVGYLVSLVRVKQGATVSAAFSHEAPVERADVIAWVAERLEELQPGAGAQYRGMSAGEPGAMLYKIEQQERELESGEPFDSPQVMWARGLDSPASLLLGTAAPRVVISGEQLAWFYWFSLPPSVRHAQALFRDVERIASGDEPRSRLERVARLALAKADADASDDACDKLAGALRRNVEKLRPILRLDGLPPTTEREALELLVTISDAFASYVEKRGDAGATVARDVRAHAKRDASADAGKRWANWRAEPGAEPPWIVALAVVVWLHKVAREVAQRPALQIQIHENAARFHSRTHILETRDGQRALTFDDSDPFVLVPTVGGDVIAALVEQGVKHLGSVPAYHLLRWEVLEAHARVMRHEPDARVLQHDGSWDSFTHDVLGLPGKSIPKIVRAVAWTQDAVRFPTADGDAARLINLREKPNQGRRRGSLEFLIGTVLLPHYGLSLPKSADHRLVPMLRGLPPMAGREREHGAVMTLSMLLMRELRVRALELVTDGGVAISEERWKALAIQAGLPLVTLPKVIDRWLQDGTDAPALLSSPWKGGYTLGDAHEPERDFLVAAGKLSAARSAAGRRSVQANNRKRNGQGGR